MPEGSSVGDLVREVLRLHPQLEALIGATKLSLNLDVVPQDARLRDGDEVGFLPPVAGG